MSKVLLVLILLLFHSQVCTVMKYQLCASWPSYLKFLCLEVTTSSETVTALSISSHVLHFEVLSIRSVCFYSTSAGIKRYRYIFINCSERRTIIKLVRARLFGRPCVCRYVCTGPRYQGTM
ncbi:hypothetical protein F5Y07DRAFT_60685 [Xylaria sp. FL0933]|nr:hypothetical protein F5Y07DRAFT_60685 [Xylaria sp. FL0933]